MAEPDGSRVDLSASLATTTNLIGNPLDWRVRVVEQIEIDTGTGCKRRRSLQAAPIRSLIPTGLADHASSALLVLNLASVPRGALVSLDIQGHDDSPAFLLPRLEVAERQLHFLRSLMTEIDLAIDPAVSTLIRDLIGRTRTTWEIDAVDYLLDGGPTSVLPLEPVRELLSDGIGKQVSDELLHQWLGIDQQVASLLAKLDQRSDGLNPCLHPILGLPGVAGSTFDTDADTLSTLTRSMLGYLEVIRTLTRLADCAEPSAAGDLLVALVDYGRNYDLLVATIVPLDEPFIVKFSERRGLQFSLFNRASQELVICDALSNHVLLTVSDPNIEIKEVTAWSDQQFKTQAYGAFATTNTPQTYAIYAHDDDRDFRVILRFYLRPLGRLSFAFYCSAVLVACLVVGLIVEHPRRLQDLALVVGPSALAATLLLNREPSTLGSLLRRVSTGVLTTALAALVLAAVLSYLGWLS